MRVDATKISTNGPADTFLLEQFLDDGRIRAEDVVCIIGKTEGNGGRNDFTRDLAMRAFEEVFSARLAIPRDAVGDRIIFSLSGGTEGIVSPHIVVFTKREDGMTATSGKPLPGVTATSGKRLALASGFTRDFAPDEIGRMPQIEETARVVRQLVSELHADPDDVHLVQMKGAIPAATFAAAQAAEAAGRPLRNDMVHSRGASALGVALALGEVSSAQLSDDVVCRDWSLYSGVASCSAKPGLARTEVLLFANVAGAGGDLVIEHTPLEDMLDVRSIHALLARLGLPADMQLTDPQRARIVGVFAKSEADPRGTIRGRRHTMLTDDDISDTRYSRCVLSSVLAAILGETAVYVSTRAEHHGPLGGGTLAIIARTS
jgi:cyanuric acid amidohydrolase